MTSMLQNLPYHLRNALFLSRIGPGGHQQVGSEHLQDIGAFSPEASHLRHVRHLSGESQITF